MPGGESSIALPSLVVALLVAAVGYLVRRMVAGFDKLGTKVDLLVDRDAKRDQLAAEHAVRINQLERQLDMQQRKLDDLSGFLSKQERGGFSRARRRMSDARIQMHDWLLEQESAPYVFGSKGNLHTAPGGKQVACYDCSGLVTCAALLQEERPRTGGRHTVQPGCSTRSSM